MCGLLYWHIITELRWYAFPFSKNLIFFKKHHSNQDFLFCLTNSKERPIIYFGCPRILLLGRNSVLLRKHSFTICSAKRQSWCNLCKIDIHKPVGNCIIILYVFSPLVSKNLVLITSGMSRIYMTFQSFHSELLGQFHWRLPKMPTTMIKSQTTK